MIFFFVGAGVFEEVDEFFDEFDCFVVDFWEFIVVN
jgi:hypothetical protein